MILALDIGNTRLKWAAHEHGEFMREGVLALSALHSLRAEWAALPVPSRVIGANVAGAEVQAMIESATQQWPVTLQWVVPRSAQCGVVNHYDNPAQLGPDRWAALIAARARVKGACVVANAGTALTVDTLSGTGEFLGGLILPGLELMQQALSDNTARLAQLRGTWKIFPRNSGDAITCGALNGASGAVQRMAQALQHAGHASPRLLLTGGNAQALLPLLPGAEHAERLVLEGLVRLAPETS